MKPLAIRSMSKLLVELGDVKREVEALINNTPTGSARNALCDANIHAYATIEALQLAMEELKK